MQFMVNTFFIQKGDQQYSDSNLKGLPSYVQQQRPISSVATPQTIRSYPTPSTAGQWNRLGKLHATPINGHIVIMICIRLRMHKRAHVHMA